MELPQVVKPAKHLKIPAKLCSNTGTSYSAPTRLSFDGRTDGNIKSMLPWRFVSKYQNRSNGGIPMFSEERLQERKEKVRINPREPVIIIAAFAVTKHGPFLRAWHSLEGNVNSIIITYEDAILILVQSFNTTPVWPRHSVPIEGSKANYTTYSYHNTQRRSIMPFKLSPQLTKYITEIWKNNC